MSEDPEKLVQEARERLKRPEGYVCWSQKMIPRLCDALEEREREVERLREEAKRLSRVPCGKCHGVGEITLDEQAIRVFCPRCEGKGYLTPVEPWRYREREEGG